MTTPLTALLRPEPSGRVAAEMIVVDCPATLTHYSGQGIPVIGVPHQQSAASALFAGFHTSPTSPCLLHTFTRINSGGNHFRLCRAETTGASEIPFIVTSPQGLIVHGW